MGFAIPNEFLSFGAPYLTLIAFVPFYLCFPKLRNYKQAFLTGFLQAITTHLISSFWLAYFKDFAIFTLGASALGTGGIGAFFGWIFYLPYAEQKDRNSLTRNSLCGGFFNTGSFRIIYFAAVYTAYEWVKSSGFLGYPWGTVSSAMFRWPVLMQVSAVTGTYGITFFILIFNALLAEAATFAKGTFYVEKDSGTEKIMFSLKTTFRLFLIFAGLILLYGLYQYNIPRKAIKTLTAVLVQQNADPWKQSTDDDTILLSEKLTEEKLAELRADGKKADLVVWSEGVLTRSFPYGEAHYQKNPKEHPLISFIKENKTPFLVGGSYVKNQEKRLINNAAVVFDEKGNFRGYYAKNHLVPFAEVIPFSDIPAVRNFIKKIVGISAGWTPGDQYVFFDIPCSPTENYRLPAVKNIDITKPLEQQKAEENESVKVRICTPICFDDAFTDIMRPLYLNGAEVFLNITDDSWSLTNSSEIQHFEIASYRAIEYRTTLVRCANAGYSVVVSPAGRVLQDMPLFTESAITAQVPVYKRKMTTYARFGNWLPYTLIVLILAYIAYRIATFAPTDYIPSGRKMRKIKKPHKKHGKKK